MYHSVYFSDGTVDAEGELVYKNSYDDFHLIPSNRPVINPPSLKTKYLDIPGANGSLDISEVLTGYPVFENRSGSIEFIVLNQFDGIEPYRWEEVYSNIMNYLHGQKMRMKLEDDPRFFYEGRLVVNQWNTQKDRSRITIDYNVSPYKYADESSIDRWKWDPFNFRTDYVLPMFFKDIAVSGTVTKDYDAVLFGDAPLTPDFVVNSSSGIKITMIVDGKSVTKTFTTGTSKIYELSIYKKDVRMIFQGNGTVSIKFYRGYL